MTDICFDFDQVFDEDYLHFYTAMLSSEKTQQQAELICQLLAIEPGMAILDLACGYGRIANAIATRGCHITGLDASPLFLERARAETLDGVQVAYEQGDMRTLPWTARFDRIINWFTSYGYFDDEDNRQVLREACRALKPGGKLLIDHQNRDRWLQLMPTHVVFEHPQVQGDFMIDRVSYEVLTGRHETERTVIRAGQTRKMHFSVRLFTFPELRDWLFQAGFSGVEGYGADGEPLKWESRRMIVVASKE